MSSYTTLLVKMGMDARVSPKSTVVATGNFDFLVDVDVLLSLALFIPMLNKVHCLIKLTQAHDIFVCDFMQSIKVCQNELARMFIVPSTAYYTVEFAQYNKIVQLKSADIPLLWRPLEGDNSLCHLVFNLNINTIFARCKDRFIGVKIFVTQEEFNRYQDTAEW